ncbi:SIS domain-containing protein [Falsiroseomonas bella]|nr:SIS domain-containing protein [Falsiroseomonas bella]
MARQPEVIAGLLARAPEFLAAGATLAPGAGGRLFVAGCGDGAFAAEAAAEFARELGLDWRPLGALDLLLSARRLAAADRVIAISMSGNVDRTVAAAEAASGMGARLLALVNGKGGRLGEVAGARISLDIADIAPFLCGTSSYTATVAALMLLAAGAAGRPEAAEALHAALPAIRAAIAFEVTEAVPSGVRLLSAGADAGTVRYGAAKLVELTGVPAWSADLEEFAHSQYWATPVTDLIVVVAAEPALARLATESCEALAELGMRCLAMDTEATPVATATRRWTLPAIPPALAPLATAIPLQALAHGLARAGGLDPDTRTHLKGDAARFRVSRMLTRRSLIGTGQ